MRAALVSLFVFIFVLAPNSSASEVVNAPHAMVVSSHALASEAGLQVMHEGGNAIDAAVATGLALAVVHPSAGNIGGGGFMVVFTKTGQVTTFDFREKAPEAANAKMYLSSDGQYVKDSNHEGYRSVGVPGTIAGFDLALKRFGTKSWRDLTTPAIKLADDGFALSPALAERFGKLKADWKKYPASGKVFLHADGSEYKAGETWKQPDLARTLKRIQENGRNGFYFGETAQAIALDMQKHLGLITLLDLAHYRAVERAPIHGTYHGYDIYSMPPPSSGGIALVEMLNILEPYDLKSLGHNSASYTHLLAETMRRAFADRANFLGDTDFGSEIGLEKLTAKEHAASLRKSIDPKHASPSDPQKFGDVYESPETTHYSVIDNQGNAVVVTYTLEYSYGSRIVANGLGFLYNNEMGDFNPQPGRTDATGMIGTPPNIIAPGKRMLSSMTPTIVAREGRPRLLIGSPGGRTIINTVLQTTLNVLDFHMDIDSALAAPRFHHQWLPNEILFERGAFTEETQKALREMGHQLRDGPPIGEVMGIYIDPQNNHRLGAADPRSPDGKAVGY